MTDGPNRAERREMRRARKTLRVRAWKRAFKGILTPRDVIAIGGRHGA